MTGGNDFPTYGILANALIENHVEFLRTHRSRIEREDGLWRCISEKPSFCFAILTSPERLPRLPDDAILYIPSWLENAMPEQSRKALTAAHALNYMVRPPAGSDKEDASIARVKDREQMEDYAEVQGRAFCEDEETYREWRPWMGAADQNNLGNPLQDFFVQYESGRPVAGSITVYASSFAGIYGVATLPSHRKQGRAAALLSHTGAQAARRGISLLGLQAAVGSDAERLYAAKGFLSLFRMQVYRRTA